MSAATLCGQATSAAQCTALDAILPAVCLFNIDVCAPGRHAAIIPSLLCSSPRNHTSCGLSEFSFKWNTPRKPLPQACLFPNRSVVPLHAHLEPAGADNHGPPSCVRPRAETASVVLLQRHPAKATAWFLRSPASRSVCH